MPNNGDRIHVLGVPDDLAPYVAIFSAIKYLWERKVIDVGVDRVVATAPGMPGVNPAEQWSSIILLLSSILATFWLLGLLAGVLAVVLAVGFWPLVARIINDRCVSRTRHGALSGNVHGFFSLWLVHALSIRDKSTGYVYTRRSVVDEGQSTIAAIPAPDAKASIGAAEGPGEVVEEPPTAALFDMVRDRVSDCLEGMTLDDVVRLPIYVNPPGPVGDLSTEYRRQMNAASVGRWIDVQES